MAALSAAPVKLLANLAAFQLGWFACVLGGSLIGGIAVALILALHLAWLGRPGEWRWLAAFAALGIAIDGALALAGGFAFPDDTLAVAGLPPWLWLLWPLFATLIHHSLAWLWSLPWLAVLGGATGAPLSYYAGARLAGVELAPWLLPAEGIAWALLCLILSRRLGHATALEGRPR